MDIHYEGLLTCRYGQTLLSGKPDGKLELCPCHPSQSLTASFQAALKLLTISQQQSRSDHKARQKEMRQHSTLCSCWLWSGWATPAGSHPRAWLWVPSLGNPHRALHFPRLWGRQPEGPPQPRGHHSNVSGHTPCILPWSSLEGSWYDLQQDIRGEGLTSLILPWAQLVYKWRVDVWH